MPLPASNVGRATEPVTFAVDARWTMAYAASLDDHLPCYLDTTRADGVVAHPLFPVCPEWPVVLDAGALTSRDALTVDERLRSVHATHDLEIHRLVRAGDELTTVATIEAVERRKPGGYQVLRLDTNDASGQPVATTRMGALYLGTDVVGEDRPPVPDDGWPPGLHDDHGPRLGTSVVDIPVNLAHTYTECARIYNPIHTDALAAARGGLPAPILHGTATLALAVSEIVRTLAAEDPARVRRIRCRFGAMVLPGSTITIKVLKQVPLPAEAASSAVAFEVANDQGQPAIRDGIVVLA